MEILESDFVKSYMDKPAVKHLYKAEVEFVETDEVKVDNKGLGIPSDRDLPSKVRDGMIRKNVTEHMIGGLYHAYLEKLATDILLPKVKHAYYALCELDRNNIFNIPRIADIVEEEMGKSNGYLMEALKLMCEWEKLGMWVRKGGIDADTAIISSERKAMSWCYEIEASRAHSLAYIFASLQLGEKWACARDLTVFYISDYGHDVRPYIEAWHEFEHPEAVRRISDFDFSNATKADAPASRHAESDEDKTAWYIR